MAIFCSSYDLASDKICFELPFRNEEGRELEVVRVERIRTNGVPTAVVTPSWLTWEEEGCVVAVRDDAGSITDTYFLLTVTVCADKSESFDTDGEDTIYTLAVEVQRTDCIGGSVLCVFPFRARKRCVDINNEQVGWTLQFFGQKAVPSVAGWTLTFIGS